MSLPRIYLDQDVDVTLAIRLRTRGYDVVTTRDAGNLNLSNAAQLEYAAKSGRSLLTHNRRHFRRLHGDWLNQGKHHCGIIVSTHLSLDELERRLLNLLQSISQEQAADRLFSLADFG
jgi:predicted nuclease of predicted toxin-antitoxin system